jgi:hypothetical protein
VAICVVCAVSTKDDNERSTSVRRWVEGYLYAADGLMQARYTEMAVAFVHILRSLNILCTLYFREIPIITAPSVRRGTTGSGYYAPGPWSDARAPRPRQSAVSSHARAAEVTVLEARMGVGATVK